ncbi:MAG: hypothetical protein Q7U89_03355 [Coriobacteriia bacterium]|nr:hypothetical protein [Coriobacteriia bacterium]
MAVENEQLNAYLVWADATDDYEAYRSAHPDFASYDCHSRGMLP